MEVEIFYENDDVDLQDEDVEYPEPHSIDDPWWSGARADW